MYTQTWASELTTLNNDHLPIAITILKLYITNALWTTTTCQRPLFLGSKAGVHNSNLISGQKKKFPMPAGQIVMCLPIQRVHLTIKQPKSLTFWAKRAKLNASAGHTWPAGRMLCMPGLKGSCCSKVWQYSQTCVQQPPSGPQISGCCWQVVIVRR